MFDNIGGKIKTLAKVVSWIGIIASGISGIVIMATFETDASNLIGLLVAVLGSLISWLGSFMTYGFGQLIENSDILVSEKNNGSVKSSVDKIETLNKWKEQGLITEQEYNEKMESLK